MVDNLFYDCPIKAAYMAKNFGVIYQINFDDGGVEIIRNYKELNIDMYIEKSEWKYNVHPDSLSIFYPKTNDIVECHFKIFLEEQSSTQLRYWPEYHGDFELERIIERNGKAFIMPQESK